MSVDKTDTTFLPSKRDNLPEYRQQTIMNTINVNENVNCSHVFQ